MFYTYILSHNNIPFYVGKGTGNRMYNHDLDRPAMLKVCNGTRQHHKQWSKI